MNSKEWRVIFNVLNMVKESYHSLRADLLQHLLCSRASLIQVPQFTKLHRILLAADVVCSDVHEVLVV
jgi:hypothetical protein